MAAPISQEPSTVPRAPIGLLAGARCRRVLYPVALLLALLPSAWLAWNSKDLPYLGQYHDDGLYWNTARSLAEGHGYRIQSLPEEPFETKYPPLFSLALALICRICPDNAAAQRFAMLFVWAVLPVFVVLALRAMADLGLGRHQRAIVALLLALNPVAALLATNLLSELSFCCLVLWSAILAENAIARNSGIAALGAGIVAALSYLTRTAGVALIASGVIYFLLRRRRRAALLYGVGSLPAVVIWTLWAHLYRSPSPDLFYYTDYLGFRSVTFGDLPRLLSINLLHLIRSAGGLIVFDLHDTVWERFAGAILGLIAIWGSVGIARLSGIRLFHLFAAGYVLMLVDWHFPPTERFLFPIAPMLLAGFLAELRRLGNLSVTFWRSGRPMPRLFSVGLSSALVLLLGSAVANTAVAFSREFPAYTAQQYRFQDSCNRAFAWIRTSTPSSASFLAYYDTAVYLHTGRHAQRPIVPVMPFYRGNRDEYMRYIANLPAFVRSRNFQYYFATPLDFRWGELVATERRALSRVLDENGDFQRVYQADNISIYRVRNAKAAP